MIAVNIMKYKYLGEVKEKGVRLCVFVPAQTDASLNVCLFHIMFLSMRRTNES